MKKISIALIATLILVQSSVISLAKEASKPILSEKLSYKAVYKPVISPTPVMPSPIIKPHPTFPTAYKGTGYVKAEKITVNKKLVGYIYFFYTGGKKYHLTGNVKGLEYTPYDLTTIKGIHTPYNNPLDFPVVLGSIHVNSYTIDADIAF